MVRAAAVEVSHSARAVRPCGWIGIRLTQIDFCHDFSHSLRDKSERGTKGQGAQLFPERQFIVGPRSAVSLIAGAFFFVLCWEWTRGPKVHPAPARMRPSLRSWPR